MVRWSGGTRRQMDLPSFRFQCNAGRLAETLIITATQARSTPNASFRRTRRNRDSFTIPTSSVRGTGRSGSGVASALVATSLCRAFGSRLLSSCGRLRSSQSPVGRWRMAIWQPTRRGSISGCRRESPLPESMLDKIRSWQANEGNLLENLDERCLSSATSSRGPIKLSK